MGTVFKALNKSVDENHSEQLFSEAPEREVAAPPKEPKIARVSSRKSDVPQDHKELIMEGWDPRLIEVLTSAPLVREGVRRLRNKILHPSDNRKLKSILLTSAIPGEGKSFICANLGISLAQGVEKHAIMVDCDLRRPSLAALFGMGNDLGLVDYLNNSKELSELIRKTGQQKLSIIPSGLPPDNPAEIVDSKKMVSVIKEMSERYPDRIVLLDSPPLLAAAETVVLADQVDGVVLVVRWGASGRQQVKELVETIGKEKIVGIVFNAFELNTLEKNIQKMKGYEGYYKYASGY